MYIFERSVKQLKSAIPILENAFQFSTVKEEVCYKF